MSTGNIKIQSPKGAKRIFDPYRHLEFTKPETKKDFPKLLYHPKGETKVIMPGNLEVSPDGRREVMNQHLAVVTRKVLDKEELEQALKEGWHLTLKEAELARQAKRDASPKTSAEISGLGK